MDVHLRADLLSLLAVGPVSALRLSRHLHVNSTLVRWELRELRADGLVLQHPDTRRWELAPARVAEPARPTRDPIRMCTRCRQRYRQGSSELCRRCERETGVPVSSTFEQDAARIVRMAPAPLVHVDDPVRDGGVRTITIDGIEYDALSVGSAPVTRAYGSGSGLAASHRVTLGGRN